MEKHWESGELFGLLGGLEAAICSHSRLSVEILSSDDRAALAEAYAFMETCHQANGQRYLLSDSQRAIESRLGLRERSVLFVARDGGGGLCSVLRATPRPFEMSVLLAGTEAYLGDCADYLELSRFTSRAEDVPPSAPLLLMASACHWALAAHSYGGFVALTRLSQQRLFSRFGLRSPHSAPFILPDRGFGEYWLLRGDWRSIAPAAVRYMKNRESSQPSEISLQP